MKKFICLLIMICSALSLTGCGNKDTINTQKTIVLNIDSDVTPNFTSNYGTGTYNEKDKVYTHTIDYVKDLYIYLSYDDLKTVTVYIPTKEMNDNVIVKNVEFGKELDVEVEITVEGVKSLEGLEVDENLEYTNLSIGEKNKFKLILPSRKKDYNIKFTLPEYRKFEIKLDKEQLVGGTFQLNTMAIKEDEIYIGFKGEGYYSYEIYSSSTNQLVNSNSFNSYSDKIQYVSLPNNDGYYVSVYGNLFKVEKGKDKIIELENNISSAHYLNINLDETLPEYYSKAYLYNYVNKTLSIGTSFDSLENLGLLLNVNNTYLYMPNLKDKATADNEYTYSYNCNLTKTDFIEVDFELTKINRVTNEIIVKQNYGDINGNDNDIVSVNFDNNKFKISTFATKTGSVDIDLYNKENVKVTTITRTIDEWFKSQIISGTITYKNKTIPYQIPVFLEDLVYENERYTYPNQVIDTESVLTKIYIMDGDGGLYDFGNMHYSPYIIDEDLEVVMGTTVAYDTYFKIKEGKKYTLKSGNESYEFTPTKEDIDSGNIFILNGIGKFVEIKVPDNYFIKTFHQSILLYPNSNNIVKVPITKNETDISFYVSNGEVSYSFYERIEDLENLIIYPFYLVNNGALSNGSEDYFVDNIGNESKVYYYIKPKENGVFPTKVLSTIKKCTSVSCSESYINISEFTYNETYNAYYYDIEAKTDHKVLIKSDLYNNYCKINGIYYMGNAVYKDGEYYYVLYINNGTTITYKPNNSPAYTFKSSDPKVLKIYVKTQSSKSEFEIVSVDE